MEIEVRLLKTTIRPASGDDPSAGVSEEELITSLIVPIPSSCVNHQSRDTEDSADEETSTSTTLTVGRADSSDLPITHDSVSQLHCNLIISPDSVALGGLYVVDKSRNGVLHEGKKLEKNVKTFVKFGERVYVAHKKNGEAVWIVCENKSLTCSQASTLRSPITEQTLTDEIEAIETEENNHANLPRTDVAITQTLDPCLLTEEPSNQEVTGTSNSNLGVETCASEVLSPCTSTSNDRKRKVSVYSSEISGSSTAKRIALSSQINVDSVEPSNDLPEAASDETKTHNETEPKTLTRSESNDMVKKLGEHIANDLKCSICREIFHQPVSLQPCLHTFCGACYSQWMESSRDCPECRTQTISMNKNHLVKNLCDTYLTMNPSQKRPQEDLDYLDSVNKIKEESMNHPFTSNRLGFHNNGEPSILIIGSGGNGLDYDSGEESSGDNSRGSNSPVSDFSESSQPSPVSVTSTSGHFGAIRCQQCPSILTRDSVGISSSSFVCPTRNARHLTCQCCAQFMPDRRQVSYPNSSDPAVSSQGADAEWRKQRCDVCIQPFCRLYFEFCDPTNSRDCPTCISHFKDFRFTEFEFKSIIYGNRYESLILVDYLNSKNISLTSFFTDSILSQLPFTNSAGYTLEQNSILCRECALRKTGLLCYEYRKRIPEADLPRTVSNRPDCWYGWNCLTQRSRDSHANRYNHICEPSR